MLAGRVVRWVAIALVAGRLPSQAIQPVLTATALRTEYLVNPVGIDAVRPRFSWQLVTPQPATLQTSYEIQVGRDSIALVRGRDLLWSSSVHRSDTSIFVAYQGPALRSRTRYYWRVRVADNHGQLSPWSALAFWETGLLTPADWSAEWIRPPASDHDSAGAPPPMLRRSFTLHGRIVSARAYVTALGLYDFYLNGQRVSSDLFTPGYTSYGTRIQYQTYDVTALLHAGANAAGVVLGDGWYRGFLGFTKGRNIYGRKVAALVQLDVRYADGHVARITSDSAWRTATGPIRFADIYKGETYDARLERTGWSTPAYDDHDWDRVEIAPAPTAALVAPVDPPVRRTRTITPIAILHSPSGETIYDLGQNMTGWVRLRVHGPAGTLITLRHGEVLDHDGNVYTANLREADQTDRYTMRGGGEEVYEPHFTYHGFRYVAVDGLPSPPTLAMITGIVIHSDLPETGTFETSDTMLNRLQHNILWGQRGNFLDFPTDCPQRDERLGWTGDAQVFARTAAFNMDVSGFFAKWLADLAADQHADGSVPWVIPNALGGDSDTDAGTPGWSDASTVVPWTMYLMYGDRGLLARQYPSMRAWADYARRRAGPTLVWRTGGFGDWLAWHSDDASYPGATTGKDFIATAYLAHSTDLVARAAAVLGRDADARMYRARFDSIRTAFRREFVTPDGRVAENTQTAYALALDFNLLSDSAETGAARRLAADVRAHDDHLTTGFLGTPELLHALSQHGFVDAAYRLLLQRTYPSWLYPITRGATTMWERWDGIRPDGSFEDTSMNSFDHYAFGAVGDWMYRVIGGIDVDPAAPGYKHVLIAPTPGGGVTSASIALQTGYGRLAVAWRLAGARLVVDITLPANTSATVTLPRVSPDQVLAGAMPLAGSPGVAAVRGQSGNAVFELGSGRYQFVAAGGGPDGSASH